MVLQLHLVQICLPRRLFGSCRRLLWLASRSCSCSRLLMLLMPTPRRHRLSRDPRLSLSSAVRVTQGFSLWFRSMRRDFCLTPRLTIILYHFVETHQAILAPKFITADAGTADTGFTGLRKQESQIRVLWRRSGLSCSILVPHGPVLTPPRPSLAPRSG